MSHHSPFSSPSPNAEQTINMRSPTDPFSPIWPIPPPTSHFASLTWESRTFHICLIFPPTSSSRPSPSNSGSQSNQHHSASDSPDHTNDVRSAQPHYHYQTRHVFSIRQHPLPNQSRFALPRGNSHSALYAAPRPPLMRVPSSPTSPTSPTSSPAPSRPNLSSRNPSHSASQNPPRHSRPRQRQGPPYTMYLTSSIPTDHNLEDIHQRAERLEQARFFCAVNGLEMRWVIQGRIERELVRGGRMASEAAPILNNDIQREETNHQNMNNPESHTNEDARETPPSHTETQSRFRRLINRLRSSNHLSFGFNSAQSGTSIPMQMFRERETGRERESARESESTTATQQGREALQPETEMRTRMVGQEDIWIRGEGCWWQAMMRGGTGYAVVVGRRR